MTISLLVLADEKRAHLMCMGGKLWIVARAPLSQLNGSSRGLASTFTYEARELAFAFCALTPCTISTRNTCSKSKCGKE